MQKYKPGVITNYDVAEEQIIFWLNHLDIAIEDLFPPIRLTNDQKVIARQIGQCDDIKVVQSRGSGKTWLVAICLHTLCTLLPGTLVAICSSTAIQATLVIQKLRLIADQNPNVARELMSTKGGQLVTLSKDKGKCMYKNGSAIESYAIDSMRGIRAKIVVVDENLDVDQDTLNAIVAPIKNYRRDISFNYGFKDYSSKTICITSACPKTNDFYKEFKRVLTDMKNGRDASFACALDFHAAIDGGITDAEFFEQERLRMPEETFDIEYGSIFVGANSDSAFPYELIQKCRTLRRVETEQPKGSNSKYVMGVDIATSTAKGSDNTIISVIKFSEKADGTYNKKLVFMQSFNGKTLDVLAEEVRKLYHTRFPNTIMIVYDARGLGDSFNRFFDREWIDQISGKEYPPLVVDDEPNINPIAQQILHPFRAIQALNQRLYTNMRVCLEKQTIEIPMTYREIQAEEGVIEDDQMKLTMREKAVFQEADALQFEMGSIVVKRGGNGGALYDTSSNVQHKDRYSSTAMALDYICEMEKENIQRHQRGTECVGVVGKLI